MKVKATKLGFYDLKRVQPGEEFILHDPKLFSDKWMVSLDGKAAPKRAKAKAKAKVEEVPEAVVEPEVSLEDDVI